MTYRVAADIRVFHKRGRRKGMSAGIIHAYSDRRFRSRADAAKWINAPDNAFIQEAESFGELNAIRIERETA